MIFFSQILSVANFISCKPNGLRFKRFTQKMTVVWMLLLNMTSSFLTLMKLCKMRQVEYLKNGRWLPRNENLKLCLRRYSQDSTFCTGDNLWIAFICAAYNLIVNDSNSYFLKIKKKLIWKDKNHLKNNVLINEFICIECHKSLSWLFYL